MGGWGEGQKIAAVGSSYRARARDHFFAGEKKDLEFQGLF
jgi:hypothetical protein